jgi:hypothetical protein
MNRACGIASLALMVALGNAALAAETAGQVKTLKGSATIERSGGQRMPAAVGLPIQVSDRVVTAADSSVGITLRDNTMLTAGPNSVVDLSKYAFDSTTHAGELDASVRKGTLAVISGKLAKANPQNVQFRTPNAIMGVRGTEFVIEAGEAGAH